MGTCQVRGCRCQCTMQRVSCSCQISQQASDLNLVIETTNQAQQRQNRFNEQQSSRSRKKSSPAGGNSKDSNETIKQTKSTVTHGKQSSRHSSSSPPGDPFNSSQCNICTETETKWVPVREKIKKRISGTKRASMYFQELLPQPTEVRLDTFAANGNSAAGSDELKNTDSPMKQFRVEENTSKFGPIIKEETKPQNQSSENFSHVAQGSGKKENLTMQVSIDQYLQHTPSIPQSNPLPQRQNNHVRDGGNSVDNIVSQPKASSLNALGQEHKSSNQHLQVKNLQKYATNQMDRQASLKGSAPSKSVLKQSSYQNKAHDDSFRSQRGSPKKQVKFNLPQSHYYREKIKAQQKFFK